MRCLAQLILPCPDEEQVQTLVALVDAGRLSPGDLARMAMRGSLIADAALWIVELRAMPTAAAAARAATLRECAEIVRREIPIEVLLASAGLVCS